MNTLFCIVVMMAFGFWASFVFPPSSLNWEQKLFFMVFCLAPMAVTINIAFEFFVKVLR